MECQRQKKLGGDYVEEQSKGKKNNFSRLSKCVHSQK